MQPFINSNDVSTGGPLLRILLLELEKNSPIVCYDSYRWVIISAPKSSIFYHCQQLYNRHLVFSLLPYFLKSLKPTDYTCEKLTKVRIVVYLQSWNTQIINGQHIQQISNLGLLITHSLTEIALTAENLHLNAFLSRKKRYIILLCLNA